MFVNHKNHKLSRGETCLLITRTTNYLEKRSITFNTVGEMELGPLEEKNAISGDICCPITVFVKLNFTTGFLFHKTTSLSSDNYYNLRESGATCIQIMQMFQSARNSLNAVSRVYLLASMYVSRYVPIARSTWMEGMSRDRVTSLVGNCANIRPTPLTSNTVLLATMFDLCDRDSKQRITFPLAKVAFRLPESQLLLKVKPIRSCHFSAYLGF